MVVGEADSFGMTARKATAKATAREEADSCGMTARKAMARATARARSRSLRDDS
jgi:hypothetical protein